ncbi:MAG: diacylglycerol kinase family lipid kinase [Bacteroidales bacterium]|nr:diacylglycerol kinase family lipid kinase [Bacteroidales bacterium]
MSVFNLKEKYLVIVNPNAGKCKGKKDWEKISGLLKKEGFVFEPVFTKQRHHAVELSRENIEKGYRKIIVVGGDGTMNEVVNGVFGQKKVPVSEIILGMITVGTGNDWGRMFDIPVNYTEAVSTIKKGTTFMQDAGLVKYYTGEKRESRYFINIAGLGFDALVVEKTNRQKDRGRKGVLLYFWNILANLIYYKFTITEITVDGQHVKNETFTISIGIGKYTGGGMMQTPNAIPDDGLFDLTVIKKMRKGEIIRSLKRLYDGTILDHPKVESYTAKKITINSEPEIHLEVDGESLGHSPIEFDIVPRSVQIITGHKI